jgi:hypothetical protein
MGAVMKRLLALSLVLFCASAHAQQRRLVFDTLDIVGEIQKPEIMVFISRKNLDSGYELVLRESFVPRIIESVEFKPF